VIDPLDNPRVPASRQPGCGFYVLVWILIVVVGSLVGIAMLDQGDPHTCVRTGTSCPSGYSPPVEPDPGQ
jgi:hypothetical protein